MTGQLVPNATKAVPVSSDAATRQPIEPFARCANIAPLASQTNFITTHVMVGKNQTNTVNHKR